MPRCLRFLLYSDASRLAHTQIHPDIEISELPQFTYGQPVCVGDDADDPASWPTCRVAHLVHIRREDDPDRPGKKRAVYVVYLAREQDWESFEVPMALRE